ncbi:MAG: hypothetical protein HC927_07390 [Deltaproteobacteria bacterium]|nr:hypothetical protein [Deltaproteobacteria bacterium]
MALRSEGYDIGPVERASYSFQKGLNEGLARGCAGLARRIRKILRTRGLSVPRRMSALLSRCKDLDVMLRVFDRASEVENADELVVVLQAEMSECQRERGGPPHVGAG